MKPLRVAVQPDEFLRQPLVLVFGYIFPDAVQKKRQGLQTIFDVPANFLVVRFAIIETPACKRFRKFQLSLMMFDSLNRSLMASNLDFSITPSL